MGSSLNLRGGSSLQKSLVDNITQSVHGFVVGDVLRYNTSTSKYVKAIADSAENAEVVGIVSEVTDADGFSLTYNGYVDVTSLSGITAPVLFLSGTTAGASTTNPPSAIGTVIKTVLAKNTAGAGYVFVNYLGTQIGGSSTVAIDQIQPVGSIIPYAGGVIPETWLECSGKSYAIGDYAELYTKLQYTTGSRVPMYGYVANITVGNNTSYAVGQAVSQTTPALLGTVLSLNGTAPAASGTITLTVQTISTYSTTTKNFINQNAVFTNTANNITIGGVVSTISAVSNTHFNTPDLRSRFPIGSGRITQDPERETDATWFTSVGAYPLASVGGQEGNITTAAAASGNAVNVATSPTVGTIANIPPYVATQYIIKAKPYTRAAIIDGIDIPYDQLLVRNMKTRVLGGSNSSLELYTNTAGDGGLGTQRMTITTDGLVGIGRTNPIYTLEIANSTGNGIEFGLDVFGAGTGNMLQCFNRTSGAYTKLLTSALSYSLFTSGTEKLTITSAGNVGIGTVSPSAILHTKSSGELLRLETTSASGAGYMAFFGPGAVLRGYIGRISATDNHFVVENSTANDLILSTNNLEKMRILSDGYVGIGTASPSAKLQIDGLGLNNIALQVNTSATADISLRLYEDGDSPNWMRLRPSAHASARQKGFLFSDNGDGVVLAVDTKQYRVGVGTFVPTVALDVVGAIKASTWANGQVTPAVYIQTTVPTVVGTAPVGTVWYIV